VIELDRIRRWTSISTTWLAKAAALLASSPTSTDAERFLVSYEAERLLWKTLFEAGTLASLIEPGSVEGCERLAKDLARVLRARRLGEQLARVEGRTEHEAASYLEKADALRGRT
jgi:hypothetical protein